MKQSIVGFLLVLGTLSLRADDSYIYWLQESATMDGEDFADTTYTAKFVAINGTEWSYGGGEYLELWAAGAGGTPGSSIGSDGTGVNLSPGGSLDNVPRYANITGKTGASGWTYFIELYNGNELFARSSEGLAYDDASAYVYTVGSDIISMPTAHFSAAFFVPAAAPEPTSGLMLLLGSALLALRRKRV